jgi:molybdopterin-guanine dinucleotide biosynthesis protein A
MCRSASVLAAGFVLAGGRSTRMGSDKALLSVDGHTLLEHTASNVRHAVGSVTIIAEPAKYAHFGIPVIADRYPNCGPLGGVVTALEVSHEPWNLLVACDMPDADPPFLKALIDAAASLSEPCECLAPRGPNGVEPLCAVYHRTALAKLREALRRNILRMRTATQSLNTRFLNIPGGGQLRNINTPEDWAAHE